MKLQLNEPERLKLAHSLTLTPRDLVLKLLLLTGARTSEVLTLDRNDVAHSPEGIRVQIQGAKASKHRTLLIPHVDLGEWTEGPLYAYACPGTSLASSGRLMRLHFERLTKTILGRPVNLHSLRRSYAMDVLDETKDIRSVQSALGHRSIQSTMHYLDSAQAVSVSLRMTERLSRLVS